jgi:hypothetical protein
MKFAIYCYVVGLFTGFLLAASHVKADSFPYSFGIPPLDKAIQAGYVQSGLSGYSSRLQGYMISSYAKPYDLDKLVMPYFIYKRKQIPLSLGAGVKLKIQPDRASLSIPF